MEQYTANRLSAKNVKAPLSDDMMSLKDLCRMALLKWRWFVVSVVVVMAIAMLYILRSEPVFMRSAQLMIKENSEDVSMGISSMFANMGLSASNSNVNNEIIALQSPAVIFDVVKRLHLEVSYKTPGLFRDNTVYGKDLPVSVAFPGMSDTAGCSLTLHFADDGSATMSDFKLGGKSFEDADMKVQFDKVMNTPVGPVVVSKNAAYKPPVDAVGKTSKISELLVARSSVYGVAGGCKGRLTAELNTEYSSVIDIAYSDVSIQRATDFINTLIDVYKEQWVKDKNEITLATSAFITDRLGLIERELGDVDEDISSYKSRNLLPDITASTQLDMQESAEKSNELLQLTTQLSIAQYVKEFIMKAVKQSLIPANTGIDNSSVEAQISAYNELLLQRNNLVANSSDSNPLVVDMDNSLAEMRRAIVTSVDNLIVTLNKQIAVMQQSESSTKARIADSPNQAKYLMAVGRQQKVKEELYCTFCKKGRKTSCRAPLPPTTRGLSRLRRAASAQSHRSGTTSCWWH